MAHGRIKIFTDIYPNGNIEHDKQCIPQILQDAITYHQENISAYGKLRSYYYNETDGIAISDKVNSARPDKNSKISVPRPMTTVTTINSYCFSQPFKFIGLTSEKSEAINKLNSALKADDYATTLMEITLNSAIYGLGYRYVEQASIDNIDGNEYFHSVSVSPFNAFCVYANTITQEKVLGVTFYPKDIIRVTNGIQTVKSVTVYNVFTNWHKWEFIYDGNGFENRIYNIPLQNGNNINYLQLEAMPYSFTYANLDGSERIIPKKMPIPLVEYERKPDRTNDFELTIKLMDAMNILISCSVDAVEQNTDYILVFRNIDLGEEDDNGNNPTLQRIKNYLKQGVLAYATNPGAPDTGAGIDTIKVSINQNEITSFLEWIEQELEKSLFVPNRNSSNGGADTNSSVETRNGFRSLEDIAGIITANAIKSERDFLRVVLSIASTIPSCPLNELKISDIGIKPMRNKIESLINSTQSFATMINAKVNRQTAYEVSGLVADPNETVAMDEAERDKDFAKTLDEEVERTKALSEAEPKQENSTTEQIIVDEDTADEPKTE